ncbi:MAG: CvpA family protein [Spirochaetota bacterium]
MNFIDLIILIVVVIFCIKGYLNGFIHQLFSLLIIILGFLGSFLMYRPVAIRLGEFITNGNLAMIISFFLIFITITIVLVIFRNLLIQFVFRLHLTDVDCVLGIVIGMIKGLLLCSLVLFFLFNHPFLKLNEAIGKSLIFPFLEKMVEYLLSLLPGVAGTFIKRVLAI